MVERGQVDGDGIGDGIGDGGWIKELMMVAGRNWIYLGE